MLHIHNVNVAVFCIQFFKIYTSPKPPPHNLLFHVFSQSKAKRAMLFLQSSPQLPPKNEFSQKLRVSLPSSRPLQVFHEHFVSALPQKRPNPPIPSDLPTQYPNEGCLSSSRADGKGNQKTAAAKKRLRFLEEVVLTNILMDAYRSLSSETSEPMSRW